MIKIPRLDCMKIRLCSDFFYWIKRKQRKKVGYNKTEKLPTESVKIDYYFTFS